MTRIIEQGETIAVAPDGPAISPVRRKELPVELEQFGDVMRRVRPRVTFDSDPADFLVEQLAAKAASND